MQKADLQVGDVVQIDPKLPTFGGCFMVVTEPKSWGAQGYVQNAGVVGVAFIRCSWENMEPTGGKAVWRVE